ncbi:hypothetical protein MY10362_008005 [Beauveria mimosiformis]
MFHHLVQFPLDSSRLLQIAHGADDCVLLLAKHTLQLPRAVPPNREGPVKVGMTILITGTTGRLGSHLVEVLESMGSVKRIVCLNRANGDTLGRQIRVAAENGIRLQMAKLEFLSSNCGEKRLGLAANVYQRLLGEVDHIVHNAWPPNFSAPVMAFQPNIEAVRSLVDLAAAAGKKIPITFVSSVATAARWTQKSLVPEEPTSELKTAGLGYGQSKKIASILLQQAAERCSIPVTIIHVGQIAGPLRGGCTWSRQEWLPSLIASSVLLRAIPSSLGQLDRIDWVPIQDAAQIILELSNMSGNREQTAGQADVFNLTNPQCSSWKDLVLSVRDYYLEHGIKLKLVGLSEWIGRVKRCPEDAARNPAIKFIDFLKLLVLVKFSRYQHPGFSLEKAKVASPSIRAMGHITNEMMKQWCAQWKFEQVLG